MAKTKAAFADKYQIPLPLTADKRVWASMAVVFAVICAVIMTLFYFSELFIVILFGLCLIALLNKAMTLFNKYTLKYTRKQRQVLAIAIVMLSVAVGGSLFVTQINNFTDLFVDLSGLQAMILQGTDIFIEMVPIPSAVVTDWVQNIIDRFVNTLFSYTGVFLSQALFYILALVLLYPIMFKMYFKDGAEIKAIIENAVPKRFENELKYMATKILRQANNFMVAKIMESIGIAVISCIGFYLIGLPGWLFLGILAGLLNNVPYIGPMFSIIPPAFVGLVIGWEAAVLAIGVCLAAQIVDNVYFIPFMISNKVDVNPLTTVLLILTFSQFFGALGMILSIPIYIICKIILMEAYKLLIHIFPESRS
ncbi:MAG: AI-2E family transporter [Methanosarcinales archaeon]|jgi:predicted PurR-regulated permease PerM|nr:AI-2E family transporter [Methanosarcinales archaeon]